MQNTRPIKLYRTAEFRTPPDKRTLHSKENREHVRTTVHHSFPAHEMYRGGGLTVRGTDYAGEYDKEKCIRCDCGADRTEHLIQCYRCGDTGPAEYR